MAKWSDIEGVEGNDIFDEPHYEIECDDEGLWLLYVYPDDTFEEVSNIPWSQIVHFINKANKNDTH